MVTASVPSDPHTPTGVAAPTPPPRAPEVTPDDRARVRELLGREPQGAYDIVVRRLDGDPVVLRNDPILADGTPMPTRYWLVGAREHLDVSRLEATGGVRRAEAEVPAAAVVAAHHRYAAERDSRIPLAHDGPRPSGGVAGTRTGVKCLHAHYAWYLAGGDDAVGRWVAAELAEIGIVHDVRRARPDDRPGPGDRHDHDRAGSS